MPFPDPEGPARPIRRAELLIMAALVAIGWGLMLREMWRLAWRVIG